MSVDGTDVGQSGQAIGSSLSEDQRERLGRWFPGWTLIADLSWPGQDTTVWQVRAEGLDWIVKASHATGNTRREIEAHRVLRGEPAGRIPHLRHASAAENLLVTNYLAGDVVEGSPAETDPETYRQAGQMLGRLHRPVGWSDTYLPALLGTVQRKVDSAANLIDRRIRARAARVATDAVAEPVELTFTHGDYQPRNWLVEGGQVKIIDFGRADSRHWTSDLVRLRNQQFLDRPDLAEAFHRGLGRPLREADRRLLRLETLRQAVGTIVWAHERGFTSFEAQGYAMLYRVLSQDDPV